MKIARWNHVGATGEGFVSEGAGTAEWHEAPTFSFTNPHTVRASGDVVAVPETRRLDFELELAAVIGGVDGYAGENQDVDAAASHIFGYTVMNDWSARDLQAREMKVRLGPAKGKRSSWSPNRSPSSTAEAGRARPRSVRSPRDG
ncbi:fumarylacetoacetate hydrolase family protein [Microbacterium caowuchunii]|uniref:fumarylacetoacetate hydrolase family protein n=1 Tax=Microbacterium caowuchunii TaxID=2614638 RepID=UPI0037CA5C09